jgi:hypothetical protein
MTTLQQANPPPLNQQRSISDETSRVKVFIWLQLFFLFVSIFTGGFHYNLWSMLDSALLIQSIGITGLVLVLDQPRLRRLAFMTAIILYLLALLDMGINVLVSGVVGWHAISP